MIGKAAEKLDRGEISVQRLQNASADFRIGEPTEPMDPHPTNTNITLISGLDPEEVLRRATFSCRCGEAHQRALAFYLVEIDERRLYLDLGYSSTTHLATSLLDTSQRLARELLAVGRDLASLPRIDEAFRTGKLSWTKTRILRKFATSETEAEWLAEALPLTSRQLAEKTIGLERGRRPRCERYGLPQPRLRIVAEVDPIVHQMFEDVRKNLRDDGAGTLTTGEVLAFLCEKHLRTRSGDATSRQSASGDPVDGDSASGGDGSSYRSLYRLVIHRSLETGEALLETDDGMVPLDPALADAAACEAEIVDLTVGLEPGREARARRPAPDDRPEVDPEVAPEHDDPACGRSPADASSDHTPHDRKTPAWMRKRVLARDGHRCRCCGSRARVQAHHVEFRSDGGGTRMENLLTVCARCHGLVHAGLLVIEGKDQASVTFQDRHGRRLTAPPDSLLLHAPTIEVGSLRRPEGTATAKVAVETHGNGTRVPHDKTDARGEARPELAEPEGTNGTRVPQTGQRGETGTRVPRGPAPTFLPERATAAWWQRNADLFPWNDRRQVFQIDRKVLEQHGIARAPMGEEADSPLSSLARPAGAPLLADLSGLDRIRSFLETEVESARLEGRPLDPLLLTGPPGTGKTTILESLAREFGGGFQRINGPLLRSPSVLAGWVARARPHDLLFIDEVHAVPQATCEVLYEILDRGTMTLPVAHGGVVHRIEIALPPLAFACATTHLAALPEALVSRFGGGHLEIGFYPEREIASIVTRARHAHAARCQNDVDRTPAGGGMNGGQAADAVTADVPAASGELVSVTPPDAGLSARALRILVRAARGIPRRALQLLERARKVAVAQGHEAIGTGAVVRALRDLGLDARGLGAVDRKILSILGETARPVSLSRLAALTGVPVETLRDVHEPMLLREGRIRVTARGRVAV